ncbi:MAG: hypothetical protein EXR67_00150 [Dehalococcoidia bacterium]|nr:hypothetical protein [Dehalococcoidia bacterium]
MTQFVRIVLVAVGIIVALAVVVALFSVFIAVAVVGAVIAIAYALYRRLFPRREPRVIIIPPPQRPQDQLPQDR